MGEAHPERGATDRGTLPHPPRSRVTPTPAGRHPRPDHPAAAELRRADRVARRRLARSLLAEQAEFLERSYLEPAEVAQVLAELAEEWARDAAHRIAAGLGRPAHVET